MKTIEVDEDLYRYIASQTQDIGESASDILRRLLADTLATNAHLKTVNTLEINRTLDTGKTEVNGINTDDINPLVSEVKTGIFVGKKGAGQYSLINGEQIIDSLLHSSQFCSAVNVIERFMLILSALYRIDPTCFEHASQEMGRGRTRIYFADNEAALLASGKTTRPKMIPSTPFWVITNNNTARKQKMVGGLMTQMGFDFDFVEKVVNSI